MASKRTPPYGRQWPPEAKRLWREIHTQFALEADELELLRTACDALARLYQARDQLDREGLTFKTATGQIRKHPANEIEKNARAGFISSLKALNFEWDPTEKRNVGRPMKPAI